METKLGRVFVQEPVLLTEKANHILDYEKATHIIILKRRPVQVITPVNSTHRFVLQAIEKGTLERNGISLHLDYQDYSLVRRLAGEGYAVWRIDIAGYGQSGPGEGFTKASQKISTHLLKVLTIRV